ncbi:MAG: phosphodiester glycosidase family protein [Pyrinomonadaceae bacterium]
MKYFTNTRFAESRHLVLTLCVLCALCGYSFGQDFKQVHPGVEHAQVTKEISGLNVKINLLRLDLAKVRLDVHHALDKAIGLETTSSIATRKGAVAAINSGFFRLDKSIWAGENVGLLQVDYRLVSEPSQNRTSLLISNLPNITLTGFGQPDGGLIFNESQFALSVNRELKKSDLVVYTPEFGESTLTPRGTTEIVLNNCRKFCRSIERKENAGNSMIPAGGYVIAIGSEPTPDQIRFIGTLVNWNSFLPRNLLKGIQDSLPHAGKKYAPEDAVAGVPQLIKNGKIDITWEQEKASKSFVETRHPRTAVANLKDGKFLMVTVDGRSESSGGISLQDLAQYLLSLGAVEAMNLDGGGSTTMFLDGRVVNTPSDKEGERKVGDAIVVTLRNRKK